MGLGYKYCKRAHDEEMAKGGMRAGLPKVTVDASHLGHLMAERDNLRDALKRFYEAAARYNQSPMDQAVHDYYSREKRNVEKIIPELAEDIPND